MMITYKVGYNVKVKKDSTSILNKLIFKNIFADILTWNNCPNTLIFKGWLFVRVIYVQ